MNVWTINVFVNFTDKGALGVIVSAAKTI